MRIAYVYGVLYCSIIVMDLVGHRGSQLGHYYLACYLNGWNEIDTKAPTHSQIRPIRCNWSLAWWNLLEVVSIQFSSDFNDALVCEVAWITSFQTIWLANVFVVQRRTTTLNPMEIMDFLQIKYAKVMPIQADLIVPKIAYFDMASV